MLWKFGCLHWMDGNLAGVACIRSGAQLMCWVLTVLFLCGAFQLAKTYKFTFYVVWKWVQKDDQWAKDGSDFTQIRLFFSKDNETVLFSLMSSSSVKFNVSRQVKTALKQQVLCVSVLPPVQVISLIMILEVQFVYNTMTFYNSGSSQLQSLYHPVTSVTK